MHSTAIVTDADVARSGPPTGLAATEGFRDARPSDTVDPRIEYADLPVPRARTVGISGRVFVDRNVDRRVESAGIDISARHPRDANVDPVAICLLDMTQPWPAVWHPADSARFPTTLDARASKVRTVRRLPPGYGTDPRSP